MPLEIRELVIRATVTEEPAGAAQDSREENGNENPKEELINLCVEKVLEIIREKNGR